MKITPTLIKDPFTEKNLSLIFLCPFEIISGDKNGSKPKFDFINKYELNL